MFNELTVLKYVKGRLGAPKTSLELLDGEIMDIITNHALKQFSTFYPRLSLVKLTSNNLVHGSSNVYEIPDDPETLEPFQIISIESVLNSTISAYADYEANSMRDADDMYDVINKALLAKPRNLTTFQFFEPNKISIDGTSPTNDLFLKMKTVHSPDLSTIKINQEDIFMELCLILVAQDILPIRDKYQRIGSPIGDIELNVELIREIASSKENFFSTKLNTAKALTTRVPFIIG